MNKYNFRCCKEFQSYLILWVLISFNKRTFTFQKDFHSHYPFITDFSPTLVDCLSLIFPYKEKGYIRQSWKKNTISHKGRWYKFVDLPPPPIPNNINYNLVKKAQKVSKEICQCSRPYISLVFHICQLVHCDKETKKSNVHFLPKLNFFLHIWALKATHLILLRMSPVWKILTNWLSVVASWK